MADTSKTATTAKTVANSKTGDLDAMLAARRRQSGSVRDLRQGDSERTEAGRVFLTPFGWLMTVGGQLTLLAVVVVGILVVPPVLSCRDHDQRGFFVGDTFAACARQGVVARLTDFDQRVRRFVLGSGR